MEDLLPSSCAAEHFTDASTACYDRRRRNAIYLDRSDVEVFLNKWQSQEEQAVSDEPPREEKGEEEHGE